MTNLFDQQELNQSDVVLSTLYLFQRFFDDSEQFAETPLESWSSILDDEGFDPKLFADFALQSAHINQWIGSESLIELYHDCIRRNARTYDFLHALYTLQPEYIKSAQLGLYNLTNHYLRILNTAGGSKFGDWFKRNIPSFYHWFVPRTVQQEVEQRAEGVVQDVQDIVVRDEKQQSEELIRSQEQFAQQQIQEGASKVENPILLDRKLHESAKQMAWDLMNDNQKKFEMDITDQFPELRFLRLGPERYLEQKIDMVTKLEEQSIQKGVEAELEKQAFDSDRVHLKYEELKYNEEALTSNWHKEVNEVFDAEKKRLKKELKEWGKFSKQWRKGDRLLVENLKRDDITRLAIALQYETTALFNQAKSIGKEYKKIKQEIPLDDLNDHPELLKLDNDLKTYKEPLRNAVKRLQAIEELKGFDSSNARRFIKEWDKAASFSQNSSFKDIWELRKGYNDISVRLFDFDIDTKIRAFNIYKSKVDREIGLKSYIDYLRKLSSREVRVMLREEQTEALAQIEEFFDNAKSDAYKYIPRYIDDKFFKEAITETSERVDAIIQEEIQEEIQEDIELTDQVVERRLLAAEYTIDDFIYAEWTSSVKILEDFFVRDI